MRCTYLKLFTGSLTLASLALFPFSAQALIVERNVNCTTVGVTPADFQAFKAFPVAEGTKHMGALELRATPIPEAIIELEYDVALLWVGKSNPTTKHESGRALFFGSDPLPLRLFVTHKSFYQVTGLKVTNMICHRIVSDAPVSEQVPNETPGALPIQ